MADCITAELLVSLFKYVNLDLTGARKSSRRQWEDGSEVSHCQPGPAPALTAQSGWVCQKPGLSLSPGRRGRPDRNQGLRILLPCLFFPSLFLFLFFFNPPATPSFHFEIQLKTLTWTRASHFGDQDWSLGRRSDLRAGAPSALTGSPAPPPRRGQASSRLGCAPWGPRDCRHCHRPAPAVQALVRMPR